MSHAVEDPEAFAIIQPKQADSSRNNYNHSLPYACVKFRQYVFPAPPGIPAHSARVAQVVAVRPNRREVFIQGKVRVPTNRKVRVPAGQGGGRRARPSRGGT